MSPTRTDQPATRLADLSQGASWEYVTYPGESSIRIGTSMNAGSGAPQPSGNKYVLMTPAGSGIAARSGYGSMDTGIPGALIRLIKTVRQPVGSGSGSSNAPYYRYDGTFRQDPASGDLFMLRLPSGERLDQPALVIPGSWSGTTVVQSQFLVGGRATADYRLTVDGAEVIDTPLGPTPVWRTTITVRYTLSGSRHLETKRQWIEPASGSYLQATCRDTRIILDDYSVIEIMDDEKISAYALYRNR